jgi:hypothetical protein
MDWLKLGLLLKTEKTERNGVRIALLNKLIAHRIQAINGNEESMKVNYLLFTATLLFFSSCKLLYGIRQPKDESKATLDRYLLKIGIDTTNSFVFYEPAMDSLKKSPYKPDWPVGFRPIQFKVFDASNALISQYASCEGSYKKLKLLDSYPPSNSFPFDSTQTFADDIKMYRNFDGSKVNLADENGDLHIIVYWGTWMGKFGKHLLRDLNLYKSEHPEHKIYIYKVNVGEYTVL